MASIKRNISTKSNADGLSEILLRVVVSMDIKFRIKSGIFIESSRFRDGKIVKPKLNQKEAEDIRKIDDSLVNLERFIIGLVESSPKEKLTKDYLYLKIDEWRNPDKYNVEEVKPDAMTFDEIFKTYLDFKNLSAIRVRQYKVIQRALHRFEVYKQLNGQPNYKFAFQTLQVEEVYEFEDFMVNEHTFYKDYPQLYVDYPTEVNKVRASPAPKERGGNYMATFMSKFRALVNWCLEQDIIDRNPLQKYKARFKENYGDPIYVSDEEVVTIAHCDLSARPGLAVQRDIFVLQCSIGCRVGDLMKLTPNNIHDGFITYIASKTKGEHPQEVRVPLTENATYLINKYKDVVTDGRLMPFISEQKYNDAIKDIFRLAGITRFVTRLNPTSNQPEQVRICDIAASHMARRTFCGNLYAKEKDPDLIGSMSGHVQGSRAFARYRKLDDKIKKSVIDKMGY